ncbi:hypothetical protein PF005_g11835 [Phytophthora fragariae]|uniref:Uncharacterized protein n=1 Tax=Phytophthora fragariae TaxID=53985 RepID=A0A6A3XW38_9STRA|nr:hypothetical protein PF005_g11835 [Phytophthora fragariae]
MFMVSKLYGTLSNQPIRIGSEHGTKRKLNAVTRTTASLLRRRRGQAQSASGSCAVTTAHLFQAPNVIRIPVAVLARFYLTPAHLYQPRKSFKAPQRSYFTDFLLLLNFFGRAFHCPPQPHR